MTGFLDRPRWQGWRDSVAVDVRVIERCQHCEFQVEAPFEQAREAFEAHECDRPRPTSTKRRTSGYALRR